MIWFLFITGITGIISLLSLRIMRKRISAAEILLILMTSIIAAEQAHIIIVLNLKKIEENMEMIPYWIAQIYDMVILPVLLAWNNYLWLTTHKRWVLKIGATILLIIFHVCMSWLFVRMGIHTFKQWNLGYTALLMLLVVLISLLIQGYFRSKFRKGRSPDDIGPSSEV